MPLKGAARRGSRARVSRTGWSGCGGAGAGAPPVPVGATPAFPRAARRRLPWEARPNQPPPLNFPTSGFWETEARRPRPHRCPQGSRAAAGRAGPRPLVELQMGSAERSLCLHHCVGPAAAPRPAAAAEKGQRRGEGTRAPPTLQRCPSPPATSPRCARTPRGAQAAQQHISAALLYWIEGEESFHPWDEPAGQ